VDFSRRFRRGTNTATTHDRGGVAVDEREPPPPDPSTRVAPPVAVPEGTREAAPISPADGETAPPAERPTPAAREIRERQREAFGGFNWGAAFFGWLVAVGLAALLTSIVTATGAAVGLTKNDVGGADTIGILGGILLLVVAAVAWYCGGYVAGRMSRFDGARQGFGVWLLTIFATVLIAVAGWVLGNEYNVLDKLNLPRIPDNAGDLTTGALIALGVILLGTLVATVVGGRMGELYHNRIDRYGFREQGL
jgi:hypothetical protein